MHTLKVRDRTTGKVRDVLIDIEDHERLSEFTYLTDKNSAEPFREAVSPEGKRPRIALKRDVMGFKLGDPRRVCYVDKSQLFDCRKTNLKVKTERKPMVKIVKTVDIKVEKESTPQTPVSVVNVVAPVLAAASELNELEIKRTLLNQINQDKLLEMISVDKLLGAWAETHGYEKKQSA